MGKGLRVKSWKLVSLLFMFSLEMVSVLQRDGKGRSSRERRGVGRLQQHLPLKVICFNCFLNLQRNPYMSITLRSKLRSINCVKERW
jgi:hypothetical protein